MTPRTVKGISVALIVAIAIASGISGALIRGWILMPRAFEEPKRSYTGEELARDEEGFIVFGKVTTYWRGTLSVQGIGDLEEIPLNNVRDLFAFVGSATFEIKSPGLYMFKYSVKPSLERPLNI